MSETPYLQRDVEARRELGTTAVRGPVAAALTVLFLLVVSVVPVVEHLTPVGTGWSSFAPLTEAIEEAATELDDSGLFTTNRRLLAAMNGFEDRLEEESWVTDAMLPYVQYGLTRTLGVGNQQVYLGTEEWLFFRPAVDPIVGPPFLAPEQLERRREAGDAWEEPVEPNPLPAIEELHGDLARRGIGLLVVPTPVKASIHPDLFVDSVRRGRGRGSAVAAAPLHNASYGDFLTRLDAAGIPYLDLAPLFVDAAAEGTEPLFLATDSHWNPTGMELAAEAIAAAVERRLGRPAEPVFYERQSQTIVGRGDLLRLLNLSPELPFVAPLFGSERITTELVLAPDGTVWEPRRGADVLVLGDSFTNVFSDARLWWGKGAGLAEQLSWILERPIDRVARNAGGASASRAALARQLEADPDRLATTQLVVYQFAERELANGDWEEISLVRSLDSEPNDS